MPNDISIKNLSLIYRRLKITRNKQREKRSRLCMQRDKNKYTLFISQSRIYCIFCRLNIYLQLNKLKLILNQRIVPFESYRITQSNPVLSKCPSFGHTQSATTMSPKERRPKRKQQQRESERVSAWTMSELSNEAEKYFGRCLDRHRTLSVVVNTKKTKSVVNV